MQWAQVGSFYSWKCMPPFTLYFFFLSDLFLFFSFFGGGRTVGMERNKGNSEETSKIWNQQEQLSSWDAQYSCFHWAGWPQAAGRTGPTVMQEEYSSVGLSLKFRIIFPTEINLRIYKGSQWKFVLL